MALDVEKTASAELNEGTNSEDIDRLIVRV